MKVFGIILMVLILSFYQGSAQKSTAKERKAAKEAAVKELIESGDFVFLARSARPLSGPEINLTSTYNMVLKGDTAEAYLPYFGRAYQAPYGSSDGGIKFEEVVSDKTIGFNKRKNLYLITFGVKTLRDYYRVSLSVGLSGYADLRIGSTNRQPISYYGVIDDPAPVTE
jgi:hypothetical protein